jgi:AraC-like DNA-binding protein
VDALDVTERRDPGHWSEVASRPPAAALLGHVTRYYGFRERTTAPLRRREGPALDVVVVVSFGEDWLIDGERFTSFAAGLHERQVTTEHGGRSFGLQIDVAPPAAHMLFGMPLSEVGQREVPLEEVLAEPWLVDRLHDAGGWAERFELLDSVLARRLAAARPPSSGVVWAWRRVRETHGGVAIGALAEELGWSRKRLVARFRAEVGLTPKAFAQLARFELARTLAERAVQPDWARIAHEAGYYDQPHLINDFRRVTGRTPVTFFQDVAVRAA